MEGNRDFLEKLTVLFFKHGAKSLTMDDIAREFSMSKKTLYQYYSNKEDVLVAVLNYTLEIIVAQIEKNKKEYQNPIEAFMNSKTNMEIFMTEAHTIFILQMNKYYSEILNRHKVEVFHTLIDVFSSNIKIGREMKYYRIDFDDKMYFKFLLQLFFSVEDSPLFEKERENQNVLCKGILDFYLNSILTEKGLQNYKELKKKYEELA